MQPIKFPECVYLGELYSPTYGDLPAYLPATQGGFCLYYSSAEQDLANRQVENTVLCLLEELPADLLQICVFDFANRPNFSFLAQLKNQNIYHVCLNEHACTETFNFLEKTIQERYHTLFSGSHSHLDHYNAHSPRPEKYFFLIINTAFFPNNNLSAQRLQNFLQYAYNAGVYVIALHDKSQIIKEHEQALRHLLNTLPKVEIDHQSNRLMIDDDTLPVSKMAAFDFRFTPADVNQSQIIEHIQSQFSQEVGNESDFLHIKIGTRPDGSDAYLSLGQKSLLFSAMLLGVSGSGKSTLMNNIIMQIGKQYHAGQIRLYLMDFAGVGFNKFKHHPNVEKIFLEANAEQQGLELLESLRPDVEIRRQLFIHQNIENIDDYNSKHPDNPLPYIIIMIDEFHRLFGGDVFHRRRVNAILSDILREWRKFGIHLFLCTQTLKDVDLDSSLKDQIGLRISYRVNHESALGMGIFDSRYHGTILALKKYQALCQTDIDQAFTAFIDQPVDIENTIAQLCATRPKHLQVKAEVVQSLPTNPPPSQPKAPPQSNPTAQNSPVIGDNPSLTSTHQNDAKLQAMMERLNQLSSAYTDDNDNDDDDDDDEIPDVFKKF